MDVLCLPDQVSATTTALARAAHGRGMLVRQPYAPGEDVGGRAHGYGGPRFMARLAADLDLAPLEPRDDWLPQLPWYLRPREMRLVPVGEARASPDRAFVKQPREKDFEAGVYAGSELPALAADTPVLVAEVVSFTREYRLLLLDGEVHAASRYPTGGTLDVRPLEADPDRSAVLGFGRGMLDEVADSLPSAVTVDVGWAVHADGDEAGWAVVEANMAWFSNSYDCDPARALDVVLRAAGQRSAFASRDRPFVRAASR